MFHLIELVKLREQQPFAYHYSSMSIEKIKNIHMQLFSEYKNFDISTHVLTTDDKSWKSVCEMDKYFEDVLCVDNFKEFGELLNSQTALDSVDLCSYILRYLHENLHLRYVSPKKMEKLLYLTYADFLEKTKRKLFPQGFAAWDFGPVEPYSRISYLRENLPSADESTDKILGSNNMNSILNSVNSVIEDYGKLSEQELIDMTHKEGSPWSINYIKGRNAPISDDDIIKYHSVEIS